MILIVIPFILGLFAFAFGAGSAVIVARLIIGGFGLFALLILQAIVRGAY